MIDNELCFLLIPFKSPFFRIHDTITKPVLQRRFKKVLTAGDIFKSTSIIEDIWTHINMARLVIADVTGKNPNVFYELGIAHTLGKDIIILTQRKDDIPFDITRYPIYPIR